MIIKVFIMLILDKIPNCFRLSTFVNPSIKKPIAVVMFVTMLILPIFFVANLIALSLSLVLMHSCLYSLIRYMKLGTLITTNIGGSNDVIRFIL